MSFDQFTNLYSLSKTLRFELKPVGKTLENMKKHLEYDKDLQTFMKDQEIEDAYQTLKLVFDKIHEDFITQSLESEEAKTIDFSDYLEKYKEKENDKGEKKLREEIGVLYKIGEKLLKNKAGKNEKGKEILKEKGFKCMTEAGILKYIEKNVDLFSFVATRDNILIALYGEDKEKKEGGVHKFFTYFSGFNQNRENYYETQDEKTTAVATRIVHTNLPKFCDNSVQFFAYNKIDKNGKKTEFNRKDEYLNTYQYLKNQGKTTQIKDVASKGMIEAYKIEEKYFDISYFNSCLSQKQIEEYNKIIGHYNLLINLYNQAKKSEEKDLLKAERKFKKLPQFKTLYKQIGCGKRDSLFFALKYDKEVEVKEEDKKENEILSVEKVLEIAKEAGKKYFIGKSDDNIINTVPMFIDWIKENNNGWMGFYWSSKAINTISNKYFANWYSIIEMVQEDPNNYKTVVSYNKKREQQIKLNDAVELKGLFELLDNSVKENKDNWQEFFFKKSILEDEKKMRIIKKYETPSKALMELIYLDIELHIKEFDREAENILGLKDYKTDENKKKIKAWMDHGLAVNQMLKYFLVNESKTKGESLNSELVEILNRLIKGDGEDEVDWFKWYDGLRNYLTKKPQDSAKDNKLKLNFGKGNLLNGFVDSHTKSDNATQYGGYLFRKYQKELSEYEYYLGISKDTKLFRCHLQNEVLEDDKSDFNRLEYYQPKSTTFFSAEYSANKEKLIKCISDNIVQIVNEKEEDFITEEEKKDFEKTKNKLLKGDTPTKLIDNIFKEKKYIEFKNIFNNEELLSLIKETIIEMKVFVKDFEKRVSSLKKLQNKDYKGIFGLKSIIDDLQKIAKETKVYNYFSVNNKEFKDACNRKEKPLYIFKITNKDFEKRFETREKDKNEKRQKNLHTLYFEALLSGNQKTIDIGKGEIFYRKQAIKKKKVKKGYEKKPWVIESKRFTKNEELEKDKSNSATDGKSFFLHLSIILNYSSEENSNINDLVNQSITKKENLYFFGLDRGEKHLIYYTIVDKNGDIIPNGQGSLNLDFKDKNGERRSIKKIKQVYNKSKKEWEEKEVECWNYNDLLDVAAANRDEARKNWQTIGNIKNLKEGYISQVIHEIVKQVTEKPMFIVLEDLNVGFMRGRQKIEKQVYQKFELALAKKLNFVVDKSKSSGEIGSVIKALQLTPPVQNYQDIENKKQVGIMFYTRANYTSQTDPLTGWRKTIYLKKGSEQKIKDQIEEKFDDINFDGKDYYFSYTNKQGKTWKLWSGKDGEDLIRYRGKRTKDKNIWETDKIAIKVKLDQIFEHFDKDKSLFVQIYDRGVELSKIEEKHTAWESLRFVIDLIQQIRNSGGENILKDNPKDDNFLLSPVRDENEEHFDSRKQKEGLPIDADANGAFNIARKGLIMNEHIKQWKKDGSKKNGKGNDLELFISDEEWDLWLNHRKGKWQEMLFVFASRKEMEYYRKKSK